MFANNRVLVREQEQNENIKNRKAITRTEREQKNYKNKMFGFSASCSGKHESDLYSAESGLGFKLKIQFRGFKRSFELKWSIIDQIE